MPLKPPTPAFNLASAALGYADADVAAFIELVRHRTTEAVEAFIVAKGPAIVHVRDADGVNPVMHATQTGHTATIDILLKHGAQIDAADNNGMTALMAASLRGFTKMVNFLLERGASMDAQDKHGLTPLMHAAYHEAVRDKQPRMSERKKDTIKLLLKKQAKLETTDNNGFTAEQRAERNGNKDAHELLTVERLWRAQELANQKRELAETIDKMRDGTQGAITAPRTASFRRPGP